MEPSKDAIAVRITRLNRQILGKATSGTSKLKRTIDRESLLDALTVLYDECNDDPIKKCDELVRVFVDKYRSTLAELRRMRVCLSDFDIVQTIGRGHFGEVHMVREKQTGDVYALKAVRKERAGRRAGGGGAEDERDVLATATAPWMPRLQYAFQDATSVYLVMELCGGGDLAGLLARRNHPVCERDAAFYVAEVAHALRALHQMGYVHRDLKPGNILIDRCGHVKLGDFGSCARLSEGESSCVPVGTPDYVAPELLAAAECAQRHSSACDYWSLGVVAFELVTLRRPFSTGDDDSIAKILSNIQKYEREVDAQPPFPAAPNGPSHEWRSLVAGLLTVQPNKRYNYLDTLQHAALAHLPTHSIRNHAPPWVPCLRGAEDASLFAVAPREPPPPSAAPFRARPPFAGQLPYVGFSYVASDDHDHSAGAGGFNASHDCTAIDLATFKSAEKLAAMRGREIASLQSKLAAAEAAVTAEAETIRRAADDEAERQRARLQAEITALSLQNRRLERQIEVEKEERMALERSHQQLAASERGCAELRAARAAGAEAGAERDALRDQLRHCEQRLRALQAERDRHAAAADNAQLQQKHYKDTIAKERALRRQTLSGGEAECREAGARVAQAEANLAKEKRTREQVEKRLEVIEAENATLQKEIDELRRELARSEEKLGERQRSADASSDQLRDANTQLARERARVAALLAQIQELERGIEEAGRREAALEEQCARTEARFNERLEVAEARATSALQDDQRHREKVSTLEQLVRQLEREVSSLESRTCPGCTGNAGAEPGAGGDTRRDLLSDTESGVDAQHAAYTQVALLKEQLERAEGQLQSRADEIAALRQEARTANLARWRKEREYNELSVEAKFSAREVKRLEERLSTSTEARKEAEKKSAELQSELNTLKPKYERATSELERVQAQLDKLKKLYETAQAEVDRSRNDIRKLKSELQYSEKRRLHAEEQEEQSSRERGQLRDELTEVRAQNHELVQNNKALQEACSMLEDQLTDLEKLADMHELKNNDLEGEAARMRSELESCRQRLMEAESEAAEKAAAANMAAQQHEDARDQAHHAHCQLQLLRERLENRESRVAELEMRNASLEGSRSAAEAALGSAMRRVRELQEECSALRTRAHHHHAAALQLQASLDVAQEEISAIREASEAANAWWRTRETKADSTLRQQAKLIDFLQAKVEEAGRKKCSLSNKLFGRSGRRSAVSPPLRRANRELREEVDRLRAKLSAHAMNGDGCPTPLRDKTPKLNRKIKIDTPDLGSQDDTVVIIWPDSTREKLRAKVVESDLVLYRGEKETRAKLLSSEPVNLPQNEANRAFSVLLEKGGCASIVCASVKERAQWVSELGVPATPAPRAPPAHLYTPPVLARRAARPLAALHVAHNTLAIGCEDGLHSLRGPVSLEWEEGGAGAGAGGEGGAAVSLVAGAAGRALLVCSGALLHSGLLALGSALRRAAALRPALPLARVQLPDVTAPHILKAMSPMVEGEGAGGEAGVCCAAACGRRVLLLRWEAAGAEFRVVRALTVDRAAHALLLTPRALYVAGDKPLRVALPGGALEAFAADDPCVSAAARRHSPPRALLLLRDHPAELLLCYKECGVFLDERGKRTRSEDPQWTSAVHAWEYVAPFLYLVGEEKVTIIHITDDAYRAPPCTCDSASVASTASECYLPDKCNLRVRQPALLGTAPAGIILRTALDDGFGVAIVEGKAAFRSIGASVESLSTSSDSKRSSSESVGRQSPSYTTMRTAEPRAPPAPPDEDAHDVSRASQDSVEPNTGFLADIRKRARQLRKKNRKDRSPEDVIKEILTTEVGLKRMSTVRKSPARISECDSDSDSSEESEPPQPLAVTATTNTTTTTNTNNTNTRTPADLCAEMMFSRQVRFQPVSFIDGN